MSFLVEAVRTRIVQGQNMTITLSGKLGHYFHQRSTRLTGFLNQTRPESIEFRKRLLGECEHKGVSTRAVPVNHGERALHHATAVFEYMPFGFGQTQVLRKTGVFFATRLTDLRKKLFIVTNSCEKAQKFHNNDI